MEEGREYTRKKQDLKICMQTRIYEYQGLAGDTLETKLEKDTWKRRRKEDTRKKKRRL